MVSLFLIKFPRPSFAGFRILSEHWCTGFEIQLYLDRLIKAASQCIYAEYVFRDEKERGKPWRIAKERGSEPQYGLKYEAPGEQLETQKFSQQDNIHAHHLVYYSFTIRFASNHDRQSANISRGAHGILKYDWLIQFTRA